MKTITKIPGVLVGSHYTAAISEVYTVRRVVESSNRTRAALQMCAWAVGGCGCGHTRERGGRPAWPRPSYAGLAPILAVNAGIWYVRSTLQYVLLTEYSALESTAQYYSVQYSVQSSVHTCMYPYSSKQVS